MSFHHLAGVTTPAAPDEVVDWFATFQAWITATVGWTIASGAGTTNLYITSAGEAGGLTKLFIHVYRVGVGNTVRMEVSDDAVPTHETNEAGTLDSGGVQFAFWMSGDKDAIVIVWKVGAGYRALYAGLVRPFAMALPDETYCMIATSNMDAASILRQHTGVWDVDITLYGTSFCERWQPSQYDSSFPIGGLCANDGNELAGQLLHVSGEIGAGAINPEDTLATGLSPATTTWIVLADSALGVNKFALRTGGVLPVGVPDGAHFAHQAGVTVSAADFLDNVLVNFLTAVGWTDLGDPGLVAGHDERLFRSPGESGTEDIIVEFLWGVAAPPQYFDLRAYDDLVPTHLIASAGARVDAGDFPVNYWITADRDRVLFTVNDHAGLYNAHWVGVVEPFCPNLPSTPYKVVTLAQGFAQYRLLRGHDGVWQQTLLFNEDSRPGANSNNNLFDGTYMVWPCYMSESLGGVLRDPAGMLPYLMYTNGGGIAVLDTIQVGAQTYTVFWDGVRWWAMRTL